MYINLIKIERILPLYNIVENNDFDGGVEANLQ